ncbi:MAG TPA: oligosaccharide flippase family protein [Isosphaeraceae bacterium]|nr:oligosaccharide flippase family protein [Isosphaeraceae bacterium]
MTILAGPERRSRPRSARPGRAAAPGPLRPAGLIWLLSSELTASVVGFAVMVQLARRLGPSAFARVEYAAAVAAWLLVVVRGGVDVIVTREAARRPRLVGPLTEVLVGLRCAAAVVGYALVLAVAALVGPERGPVVAVAGLMLIPSAFVADVGLRASGRLGALALGQAVRSLGYAAVALGLVRGPGDVLRAAWCLVAAEGLGSIVPLAIHAAEHGLPRPRYRRRAWLVLAHRGAIAGLTRFGRVSLYGADLLALGGWAGVELGSYAAARRLVFGLVALGLVVPASVAPAIARAWAAGAPTARRLIAEALAALWALSLPASVGLALTADRWMPFLFGASYRRGGPWLALVAARLPWLLTASFDQAALVSCRREAWVLDQMLGLSVLAVAVVPLAAAWGGPWGVGWAALGIEVLGAVGGWRRLARLGVAPPWHHHADGAVAGCVVLAAVCAIGSHGPLWLVVLAGAAAYVATWRTIGGRPA